MSTQAKVSAARYWAVMNAPYFATAIFAVVPREVADGTLSERGTFAMTASGIWLYEPAAFARWSAAEAGTVLIHEVMHWMRDHSGRAARINADPAIWNLAADCEINDDLAAMPKMRLPDNGGIQPHLYKLKVGLTAEAYYSALMQQSPAPKPKPEPCGSAAGNAAAGEPQGDPGARSETEAAVVRLQVAVDVLAHAKRHGMGSVPDSMRRWAEAAISPPKISWRDKLRTLGRARINYRPGGTESTYRKISRRQGGIGFGLGRPLVPAQVSVTPNVMIAIDTSGSMGESEGLRALAEADAILKTLGCSAYFVSCDCEVNASVRVRSINEIKLHLGGGGGTDFRPVFEELSRIKPSPDLVIFITDGGGYAPPTPPRGVAVIWLLVGEHRCKPMLANGGDVTWGDFIEVEEDE
jgi:predicted metal-dependent peptidase